jgi:hypothetical protein
VAVACAATTYSVGGSVSGLSGTVVLQDNGADNLSVSANGSFAFATKLAAGAAYGVTVLTNPAGQTCTVSNGSGTIGSANVTSVAVACAATTYSVGGSVSGLSGTVVLQDNGADNLSVSANGSFAFATKLAAGVAYSVTVLTNPAGQTCTVSNGSGTMGSANVTNVAVTCTTGTSVSATDNFNRADGSLGPNWTAMSDGAMVISSDMVAGGSTGNTGDIRTAESYTSDQYSQIQVTSTPSGANWIAAAVRAQNSGQNAYLGLYYGNNGSPELMLFERLNGGWTQLGSTYASGTLAAGTQLTLTAAGSSLTFSLNGAVVISASNTALTGGAPAVMAYGTTSADNWAGGDVSGSRFSVGGMVSGLSSTVVLQDNGGDNLSVSANGSFTFATPLLAGAAYSVTVLTNPGGQTCTVGNGSGTMGSANVTNVAVTCTTGTSVSAADNFNRADGSLGPNWTAMSDGAMVISSDMVAGGSTGNTGDIRTAESYTSDQYSQIQVTSTPTGANWIAAAVRAQNSGQNAYLGLYYGNNGSPELMLFERLNGGWTQLGSTYVSGTLAAGTQLTLSAAGSSLTFSLNGAVVISASDTALTGGAPAVMAFGTTSADNWAGGDVSGTRFSVGGTVSGLSGTVVLQDSGGDNLSVSASGSFTFATPVVTGSTYYVTVLTNPGGQTCTVANGAGIVGSGNVTSVAVTCTTVTNVSATDNFNRANGSLGPNWTATSDGAMVISSDMVAGGSSGNTGDIRTAESYTSDQYSQMQVTSAPTGGQWIAVAVRAQNSGQNAYAGLYFGNNGTPELMLFQRSSGTWNQLGTYASGALPAGTLLRITAVGNTIAFLENNVVVLSVTDSSLTGGAPAIMASGTATADNWAGGNAGFEVDYASTDSTGIKYYNMISANDGYGVQTLRVLGPTHPKAGVPHNFLYVLPVEQGLDNQFGDGLATLQAMDAQDQYNLTIVEPTFYLQPWFANDPLDPNIQYETFMTNELAPWVTANLSTSGTEQNWLIGFSKSGNGGQDLILKHPNVFTIAASWDFPADMSTYDGLGGSPAANYGTDPNYQAGYRLTSTFVNHYSAAFKSANRIWIGAGLNNPQDVSDYEAILTSAGIPHSYVPNQSLAHRWDSGWVPTAMAALYQDSLTLPGG